MPLAGSGWEAHDRGMFTVYCPGHDAEILLGIDEITCVDNRPEGIDIYWRCECGAEGVRQFKSDELVG